LLLVVAWIVFCLGLLIENFKKPRGVAIGVPFSRRKPLS